MDIVGYIDGRIEQGIFHPDGQAPTPDHLESMHWALDDVRNYIVSFSDPSRKAKTYTAFLMTTECEAATYCYRKRWNKETPTFDGLCSFWKQFIQWRDS